MMNQRALEWVLRIGVAGEFFGHGVFALQRRADWIGWVQKLSGLGPDAASNFIFIVGAMDILLAVLVLVKPIRIALLWMAFWGFWTALVRPLVGTDLWGKDVWDFVERFANWAAPLALYFMKGRPQSGREWFS
ncbi:MAG: hypothetical protein A2847_00655 [Candidatus Sungbacteria bacterium RIFCSPHIGHO2_01_FULL_50_25]|uniref:DoxX family protein n=1 Tax=Candidatus Sungbacteria bacterium RIFCSPHIGHO2_01_FULL_50_25 TaxID=1802265 RepID=A0A1G2KCZ9_9BACT|nr:MAG: hypothetical protein A2847_00655 [Candidatus Sungbacteria bacterium RIFCSPHIGHO2_01_FULL_50_25]